jgi:hypothetical protein
MDGSPHLVPGLRTVLNTHGRIDLARGNNDFDDPRR